MQGQEGGNLLLEGLTLLGLPNDLFTGWEEANNACNPFLPFSEWSVPGKGFML